MRIKLSDDNVLLKGVVACELGVAKGHDFEITEQFLDAVVKVAQDTGCIKCRLNHPEGRGDVLSIFGEAINFRRDGSKVRCDVRVFDIPERSRILTLAREASELCGMSLDFAGELVKQAGKKLKEMTCDAIFGLDLVDTPAATRALFSVPEKPGEYRIVCSFDTPQVDSPTVDEEDNKMDKKLLAKLCKKFSIDPKAEDAQSQVEIKLAALAEEPPAPHEEPDGDEDGLKTVLAKLEGIEKRLCKLEGVEEPPEAPVKKDEEAMATMAAKVCSIMLAKCGIRPKPSKPATSDDGGDADPGSNEHRLSAEDEKLARTMQMDEKERKQFAANLAAAKLIKSR